MSQREGLGKERMRFLLCDPGSGLCPLWASVPPPGNQQLCLSLPSSPSSTLICDPGHGVPCPSTAWMWLSPACPAARRVDWKTGNQEGHGQDRGRRRRCQKGKEGRGERSWEIPQSWMNLGKLLTRALLSPSVQGALVSTLH